MKFELLVEQISQTHLHFQGQAAKAINVALTLRNWLIGFYIVEFEQNGEDRAVYGEALISTLAQKLTSIKGADQRSLFHFREFYNRYPHLSVPSKLGTQSPKFEAADFQSITKLGTLSPKSQKAVGVQPETLLLKLSYSHFELLAQIEDELKRRFYEIEGIKGTWSVRELKRQINSLYFERSGMSLKPELLSEITQEKTESLASVDIVKSLYTFEFLGLRAKDAVEESDLESALLDHIQDFMLEMGHGFCLEARQKKILIGEEYYFVDLVFYHRILKCHVLLELKVEEFTHHNIGQLNTYVNYYKAEVMQPDDNPTVGILLVTNKNHTLVEYATAGMDNKLFVSKYLLELPKKEELQAFVNQEIEKWNK